MAYAHGGRAVSGRALRSLVEGYRRDFGEREARPKLVAHLREALQQKHLSPWDFSIRDLFEALVKDGPSIVDSWQHPKSGYGTELLEAGPGASAVGYSDFSNITGQIFFTEVMEKYENEELVFKSEIDHKPSTIQDIEKIPGVSRIGKGRDKVAEGATFPRYGVSEDYIEAPAKVKDGGIVEVTKEAVAGDKTGVLLERCGELGYDLGYGTEERVIDALIDENTGAASAHQGGHRYTWKGTAYATYQASTPWINVKTSNALTDETSIDALWQILKAITDPYTGRPVNFQPTCLIVTPNLAFRAARLLGATEIRQTAPGYATTGSPVQTVSAPAIKTVVGTLKLLCSSILKARLATDTDWFLGNPKRAVRRYYNWDVVTVNRGAGTEADFERDIVAQFKASLKDCVTTYQPRAMGKASA